MKKTVRIGLFVVGCTEPAFVEIENSLSSMQGLVGGSIQAVPMENYTDGRIGQGLWLTCNEYGKDEDLPVCRVVPGDTINGSFFLSRLDENGDLASITPEDEILLRKWTPNRMWGTFQ